MISTSHSGESERIRTADISESGSYLIQTTDSSDRVFQDARKDEDSEESDASLNEPFHDYLSSLLPRTRIQGARKGKENEGYYARTDEPSHDNRARKFHSKRFTKTKRASHLAPLMYCYND